MAKYDVAIIGGGMGGCIAAGLLSKLGKSVILLEQGPELSGRAMDFPYKDGYTLELGGHLIVDDGSGISRICEYLGRPFEIGSDNDCLPFCKWVQLGRRRKEGDQEMLCLFAPSCFST